MGEELGFDYIFGENEINNLFVDDDDSTEESKEVNTEDVDDTDDKNKTTEVDPQNLFGEDDEDKPESVGSVKDKEVKDKGDSSTDDSDGTSPNENFYSSIANAMAEDGIFPNLDAETIRKAVDAESLSDLFEAEVNARLDERQLRISKALEDGVEPSDIKKYEGVLHHISTITDKQLMEETEQGEQLRKNLIYQDYINKGISPAKAQKMTERSVDAGTDIEDAKEALLSNKEFFQEQYNKLLNEAHKEAEAEKKERQKEVEHLKTTILKDKNLLGDIDITNDLRKKALDNISKPVYKDPETGKYMTSIQKYEMEHRADFLKYVSLFYTLTNGFKDFDSFTKGKVKKEVKRGLSELEKTLSGTRRNQDGSLKMITSVKDDPESFITGGFRLDI